ncbi:ABC transporter ATP-binding protein, partial [Candidatus Calescamantes bacterium]|nr:ABC transporter ATP-binding protein [Candidatus Calescamantes bacterium]
MSKPVIKLTDVEIYYLTPFYLPGKRRQWEKIKALENINLEVNKGECIALLGDNGAGKSTLLKVIAGILKPDGGTLEVNGQVRILTELGAGFETEASGWENIFIQGALFGFSRKEMKKKAEEIAQFASLGKYLYAPLKVYSDGMYVRLAFSIAVHTEPDIFLVDDIIAVGDIHFQEKCIQRLEKMREEGKTLLIATHSLPLAERLADKGVWIDKGKIVYIGPTEEISNFYLKLSGEKGKAFFLEKGRLKLAFHNGKVFVLWNNRLLTPHYGGYTTIIRNNNAIISPNQKWEIEKHNSHEIIAQSDFLETPISQIWKIKLVSEREWEWEVSMKVRDKSRFEGIETGFLFCEDYKFLWKDGVKEELPFYKGKEWRLLKEESSFSPFHLSTKSSSYPTILWESFLKLHKKRVFLPGEEVRGRAFYWRWGEKEWEPGEHLIFAGRMRFFTSSSLLLSKDEEKGKGIYKVGNREIKICWEGNELTAPGGLSLVLEYKGNTYSPDTSKVSFFSQDTEEIKYTWRNLPFYTLFRLRGGKNYLKWRIEIISSEELELKNPRVVLNLLPYPDKWFTLRENGNFSKDFKWFPSTSAFTPFLAVSGKDTPLLLFTIEKDKNIFSFIEK